MGLTDRMDKVSETQKCLRKLSDLAVSSQGQEARNGLQTLEGIKKIWELLLLAAVRHAAV